MGEPRGHPELPFVLLGQIDSDPLPEMRRTNSNIHRHVVQRPACAAHELSLAVRVLIVQTSKDPASRARVVVLDENSIDPLFLKPSRVIGFHEKSALVSEDLRLDDQDPWN